MNWKSAAEILEGESLTDADGSHERALVAELLQSEAVVGFCKEEQKLLVDRRSAEKVIDRFKKERAEADSGMYEHLVVPGVVVAGSASAALYGFETGSIPWQISSVPLAYASLHALKTGFKNCLEARQATHKLLDLRGDYEDMEEEIEQLTVEYTEVPCSSLALQQKREYMEDLRS